MSSLFDDKLLTVWTAASNCSKCLVPISLHPSGWHRPMTAQNHYGAGATPTVSTLTLNTIMFPPIKILLLAFVYFELKTQDSIKCLDIDSSPGESYRLDSHQVSRVGKMQLRPSISTFSMLSWDPIPTQLQVII